VNGTLELTPLFPLHTEAWADVDYEALDVGIRFAVRVLHAAGISTCQSCQGGEGHAYVYPSIDMTEARAFEAMAVLERYGIRVRDVSSIWRVEGGVPGEHIWRITLYEDVAARADERPMFIAAHLHRDCWIEDVETKGKRHED
jgi:hypothetical protein